MKRIKIVLNALAITIAVAGAFATRFYMHENEKPQYIPVNNAYKPAGDFGINYNCCDSNIVCTFYKPDSVARPNEYLPFQTGWYVPLHK